MQGPDSGNVQIPLPTSIDMFIRHEFSTLPNEKVQKYVARYASAMKKMREVRVEIPDQMAAWRMLSRAGVSPWTELQVTTFCGSQLNTEQAERAVLNIFGPGHTPIIKDVHTTDGDWELDNWEDDERDCPEEDWHE